MDGFFVPKTSVSAPFSDVTCSQAEAIISPNLPFVPSKYPQWSQNLSATSQTTDSLKSSVF
jgi:hypothetical protein